MASIGQTSYCDEQYNDYPGNADHALPSTDSKDAEVVASNLDKLFAVKKEQSSAEAIEDPAGVGALPGLVMLS